MEIQFRDITVWKLDTTRGGIDNEQSPNVEESRLTFVVSGTVTTNVNLQLFVGDEKTCKNLLVLIAP
jgi:hypothetical protein